ncbi:winged helix-turn-helix transcriptional regulator [Aliibacillus thermotolerans]|uniref:Winged helix-turn-helix transcriptional regulator n=1 Tax=Aliibacillus thermotolerans TaxID=1834418 RepID=A0ABW0U5K7_9BACI|nr:helix-turn-helix domain-containing protein [Aliibacillus thermotolerans]MDA3128595.1 transcriptional regulator [Aliibacillus thermotolerans]
MDETKICPKYEAAMHLIGKKWTGLIIRVLLDGPKRFKEIKAQIPEMSDRLLTERMNELEAHAIVRRYVYPEKPVRIEYRLTEKGKELSPVIKAIQTWGEKWM